MTVIQLIEIWQQLAEHYLLRIFWGEVSEKMRITSVFFPNRDSNACFNDFRLAADAESSEISLTP